MPDHKYRRTDRLPHPNPTQTATSLRCLSRLALLMVVSLSLTACTGGSLGTAARQVNLDACSTAAAQEGSQDPQPYSGMTGVNAAQTGEFFTVGPKDKPSELWRYPSTPAADIKLSDPIAFNGGIWVLTNRRDLISLDPFRGTELSRLTLSEVSCSVSNL